MNRTWKAGIVVVLCCMVMAISWSGIAVASQPHGGEAIAFPRSLESYNDAEMTSIWAILKNRIQQEPFNLVATLIFILAILHTFMASKFLAIAHKWEKAHEERIKTGQRSVKDSRTEILDLSRE